jgi:hypothetical protein
MVRYVGPGLNEVKQQTIKSWVQESMDNQLLSFDQKHPAKWDSRKPVLSL